MKCFEFLQEANGDISSTRIFTFIIVCCTMTDYMHAIFTVGSWHPDVQTVGLLLGAIGAKVVQKFGEQKSGEQK